MRTFHIRILRKSVLRGRTAAFRAREFMVCQRLVVLQIKTSADVDISFQVTGRAVQLI